MNHDPELCATCQLHLDLYGESFWDANKGEHISPLHIFRYRNSLKADGTYGKRSLMRAPRTLEEAQEAMGMDWADWHGTKEAIPPAYTEFIGEQLIRHLKGIEVRADA